MYHIFSSYLTYFAGYRILKMMHTISAHASVNRMVPSAVAACMAPLLLRPLLAGECELEDDYDVNGDDSAQLLAAANAANNAQAIITTLLEEYESIFDVCYQNLLVPAFVVLLLEILVLLYLSTFYLKSSH